MLAQSWFLQAHDAFLQMEKTDKRPYYWQYRIGKMFSYGYGVEQDYTASADWFTKAVEGKSPFAAYALGGQYYRGQGVEQDFSQAFSLFTMAATDTSKPNAYKGLHYPLDALTRFRHPHRYDTSCQNAIRFPSWSGAFRDRGLFLRSLWSWAH